MLSEDKMVDTGLHRDRCPRDALNTDQRSQLPKCADGTADFVKRCSGSCDCRQLAGVRSIEGGVRGPHPNERLAARLESSDTVSHPGDGDQIRHQFPPLHVLACVDAV